MNTQTDVEHPNGAVQGICSGAIGLLALLIAFIGYTGFTGKAQNIPWSNADLMHLVLSLFAAISLALVPWLATKPRVTTELLTSVEVARRAFLVGAICTVLAIAIFVVRDFFANHV